MCGWLAWIDRRGWRHGQITHGPTHSPRSLEPLGAFQRGPYFALERRACAHSIGFDPARSMPPQYRPRNWAGVSTWWWHNSYPTSGSSFFGTGWCGGVARAKESEREARRQRSSSSHEHAFILCARLPTLHWLTLQCVPSVNRRLDSFLPVESKGGKEGEALDRTRFGPNRRFGFTSSTQPHTGVRQAATRGTGRPKGGAGRRREQVSLNNREGRRRLSRFRRCVV